MKWTAQVGHVARKDLRQVWGMLALYIVTIAFATTGVLRGSALGPFGSAMPGQSEQSLSLPFVVLLPIVLMLLAAFSIAQLVQQDSPSRPNALWTTRPLASSAVLSSKLLLTTMVIIGAAVLGSSLALTSIDTGAFLTLRILLGSALSCFECALAILILSALTRDLREFISTLVATGVGLFLLLASLLSGTLKPHASFAYALTVLSLGGGLWFVSRLYRLHERSLATWTTGIVVAVLLFIAALNVPQVRTDIPVLDGGSALEIAATNAAGWTEGRHLQLQLRAATTTDSLRLSFLSDSFLLRLNNGQQINEGPYRALSVIGGSLPWIGRPIRWLNVDSSSLVWTGSSTVDPLVWNRDSIAKYGVSSAKVGGTVFVHRARVIAQLPLGEGATLVSNGRRISLVGGVVHDSVEAKLRLQASYIERPAGLSSDELLRDQANMQFAIVNESLGEGLLLEAHNTSVSGGLPVLPQVSLSTMSATYSTKPMVSLDRRLPTDDRWYKNAKLVAIEWVVIGSYRTSAETSLRDTNAK